MTVDMAPFICVDILSHKGMWKNSKMSVTKKKKTYALTSLTYSCIYHSDPMTDCYLSKMDGWMDGWIDR